MTLKSYILENLNDYETGTEAIVGYLGSVPDRTIVEILPSYMTYSPMFYRPGIHYCCQLSPGKKL